MEDDFEGGVEPAEDENWYADEAATFGDRLTAGREALGLSAAELAKQLGVSRKTLSAWEQDMSGPRANRLQMLSGVLNVPMRWLVTGEGDGPGTNDPSRTEALTNILAEIRSLRGEAERTTERLTTLETRLTQVLEAGNE